MTKVNAEEYTFRDYSAALLTKETARLAEVIDDISEDLYDGDHYIVLIYGGYYLIAPSKEELEDKVVILEEPDDHGFFKFAPRAIPRMPLFFME